MKQGSVMTSEKTIPEIARRWRDPNSTPGEVLVTVHRGAFLKDNVIVAAENSVRSIERARTLGCDCVEIDVHFTSDGTAIVMHDDTLERTSTGSGPIAGMRYSDMKDIALVHPASREPFDSGIPTLEEAFLALGDTMMINVEIKTNIMDIPKIAEIAAKAGVTHQVTIKSNQKDATHLKQVADIIAGTPQIVDFVPVLVDSCHSIDMLETACELFDLSCIEFVVDYPFGPEGYNLVSRLGYTMDGGPWFSIPVRRLMHERNIRQFVNTLFVTPFEVGNQWNGGRSCQLARISPDSVYGFWIAHGATVLQTDEPEFLLDWLRSSGFRTKGASS